MLKCYNCLHVISLLKISMGTSHNGAILIIINIFITDKSWKDNALMHFGV